MNNLQMFQNNQLIPLNQNDNGEVIISSRELHNFLEVKTRYNDWFERMKSYGFVENTDFVLVTQKRVTNNPKNPLTEITDHALKLDMAKEIAMIQRNEKGKQARQYFILIEKAWNSPEMIMKRALEIANKRVEELKIENFNQKNQLEQQKPKVQYHDKVLNPTDENFKKLLTTSEIAKDLNMSARKLNLTLKELHIIYKQGKTWMPYAEHQDMIPEYFDYHVSEYGQVLKYTEKGRKWIIELLREKEIA